MITRCINLSWVVRQCCSQSGMQYPRALTEKLTTTSVGLDGSSCLTSTTSTHWTMKLAESAKYSTLGNYELLTTHDFWHSSFSKCYTPCFPLSLTPLPIAVPSLCRRSLPTPATVCDYGRIALRRSPSLPLLPPRHRFLSANPTSTNDSGNPTPLKSAPGSPSTHSTAELREHSPLSLPA